MKWMKRASFLTRIAKKTVWAFLDRYHPILAHVIPMRRCNLSCAYCNEYDGVSQPVPIETMQRRIDHLARLGTAVVTISGGEPLMHPEIDSVIRRIRQKGMIATLITNGYYLSPERIRQFNDADLDLLQISIDNVEPDDTSMKSLRLLEPKLRWLAEDANFAVSINSVVGGGVRNPADALVIARRARELGFMRSIGVIHNGEGQLKPLGDAEMSIYRELRRMKGQGATRINARFQDNLARGLPNDWRCRAGARYLYVDENGIVHYCSQQRGAPGIPIESYTRDHIRREYWIKKSCAPYCTVNCVQQVGVLDNWRSAQKGLTRLPTPGAPVRPRVGPEI